MEFFLREPARENRWYSIVWHLILGSINSTTWKLMGYFYGNYYNQLTSHYTVCRNQFSNLPFKSIELFYYNHDISTVKKNFC